MVRSRVQRCDEQAKRTFEDPIVNTAQDEEIKSLFNSLVKNATGDSWDLRRLCVEALGELVQSGKKSVSL